MGMAFLGDGAGAVPAGAVFFAGLQHIPDAVGKIFPLFDDGTPGSPDGGLFGNGQHIAEGLQILTVEKRIAAALHGIGVGCTLSVHIKHDKAIKIVFLTSSPEFAIESYDVKASGYLLKPLAYDKFSSVLSDCIHVEESEPENIVLRTLSGYDKVYYHNIDCIEAQNKRVLFRCIDGTTIETPNTISYLADKLSLDDGFFKCHRSYIAYIPNINHFDQHEIITKIGTHIPVSRTLSKPFKDAYFAYMFRKERD